jgi:hypothetical protein
VLALGALVAAGFTVVQNWAFLKLQAVSLWVAIKDVFLTGIEFILDQFTELNTLTELIPDSAKKWVPGLGFIAAAMDGVGDSARRMRTTVVLAHERMLADAGPLLTKLEGEYDAALNAAGDAQQKLINQLLASKKGAAAREPAWLAPTLEALDKLKTELEGAAQLAAVLGDNFDLAGAQASAYQNVVQALQAAHVGLDQILNKNGDTLRKCIEKMQGFQRDQVLQELAKSLAAVDMQEEALGSHFNALDGTIQALQTAVGALIAQHVKLDEVLDANGTTLRKLMEDLDRFKEKAAIGDFARGEAEKALDAFVDFTFGAKMNFGEFIRSLLQDLAKFFLKLLLIREFMKLFDVAGGVKDLAGLVKMAGGGFLPEGQLALVGEAGPELVQAGRGGLTVAPLSSARGTVGAGGGGGMDGGARITVQVNVQAMDSRDVTRFFDDNQGLVAQSMMKAWQRSQALSRRMGGR